MKARFCLVLPLLFLGCASDLKLSAFSPELRTASLGQVGFIELPGSAYPIRHNLESVRTLNFPIFAGKALQDAAAKRKKWKIVYPANILAVDPAMPAFFSERKAAYQYPLAEEQKGSLQKVYATLGTRYFLVIENISVKDMSTPQTPFMLVIGASLQMWDFKEGRMVYRARDVSRFVPYSGEDFRKKTEEALYDLFSEMISPLPKR
jgi:hypothetical protein